MFSNKLLILYQKIVNFGSEIVNFVPENCQHCVGKLLILCIEIVHFL